MAAKRCRDADVVKQRKALCLRFKRLVRSVIMNQQWLSDAEEQGYSMNVKKKVAILLRQKRKSGMLTLAEKALLRSQPWSRTIEDRKKLCMTIANLTCFAKIPPKIRARMVPVLKFMTIHTDRVLIKEGDSAITIYFIITGEVEMKKSIFNKKTKEVTWISEAIFGPGDCIGDVEKVEDCPRMNTFVTMSNCELLAIYEADYNLILKQFMTKQWNQKKAALRSLDYFEFLNEHQRIRACKFGSLVQYEPLETIYYEDKGSVSYVHFILSGECVILQCLNMVVNKKEGQSSFELIDFSNDGSSVMFPEAGKASKSGQLPVPMSRIGSNAFEFDIQDILASSSEDKETKQKDKAMRKMSLKEIEIYCGINKSFSQKKPTKKQKTLKVQRFQRRQLPEYKLEDRRYSRSLLGEEEDMELDFEIDEERMLDEDFYYEYINEENEDLEEYERRGTENRLKSRSANSSPKSRSSIFSQKSTSEIPVEDSDSESEILTVSISESSQVSSVQFTQDIFERPTQRIETHFIDVGSLTYGGIFGLGEKMEHRVIMSRTVVQCLILPRFWLLEKEQNPGNIWQLRRFYFECNVPARSELYANFLKTRKWNKFRQDYVQSVLTPSAAMGDTKEEDIPIVSRIVETSDDQPTPLQEK